MSYCVGAHFLKHRPRLAEPCQSGLATSFLTTSTHCQHEGYQILMHNSVQQMGWNHFHFLLCLSLNTTGISVFSSTACNQLYEFTLQTLSQAFNMEEFIKTKNKIKAEWRKKQHFCTSL